MTVLALRPNDATDSRIFDLSHASVRELNQTLHRLTPATNETPWTVLNPCGQHAIVVGLDASITVKVKGHAGYYCAGMNKHATVIVEGNVGVGVAENMMSGFVHVKGDASQSAGASAHGGTLLIDGNASARCGISLKGADIIVKGNVGHMSAFMAQAGSLIVFGDAGENLGDSIYEAKLFVRGNAGSLGSDCVEKEMTDAYQKELYASLRAAGVAGEVDISDFKRYGSAGQLYHFHVDRAGDY
jgi:methylamine---glutamate N-methyltransferase subunit B